MPFTSAVTMISRRSWCSRDLCRVALAHLGREVLGEHRREVGVVGERAREHVVLQRDLGVREEHRELRRGESEPGRPAIGELLVARERFHRAVQVAGELERADEARVHVFHVGGLHARVGERARLAVVVAQHEVRDLLAHGLEQIVAFATA